MALALGILAFISFALLLWQWTAAAKFRLYAGALPVATGGPGITVFKPLKGADAHTAVCLESWFQQSHAGAVQLLFGVASPDDPAGETVRRLQQKYPAVDAALHLCAPGRAANPKISTLAQLQPLARHALLVISDADVGAPANLLANLSQRLAAENSGVLSCLYRLAAPEGFALQLEAVGINSDFWAQVLQANQLSRMNFALGAVMALDRATLEAMGGFAALGDFLADDYWLGRLAAEQGRPVGLFPAVVDCYAVRTSLREVWRHQVRWARTIRVAQPAPYFFSILSNATLWPLLGAVAGGDPAGWLLAGIVVVARMLLAADCYRRLTGSGRLFAQPWLVPLKDLLGAAVWLAAFTGNEVDWRGQRFRVRRDGRLVSAAAGN